MDSENISQKAKSLVQAAQRASNVWHERYQKMLNVSIQQWDAILQPAMIWLALRQYEAMNDDASHAALQRDVLSLLDGDLVSTIGKMEELATYGAQYIGGPTGRRKTDIGLGYGVAERVLDASGAPYSEDTLAALVGDINLILADVHVQWSIGQEYTPNF